MTGRFVPDSACMALRVEWGRGVSGEIAGIVAGGSFIEVNFDENGPTGVSVTQPSEGATMIATMKRKKRITVEAPHERSDLSQWTSALARAYASPL